MELILKNLNWKYDPILRFKMNIRAYFKNLKWKYKPILRLKMKFGAGFKKLKWKWELILRFKMKFLAYGDPWFGPLVDLDTCDDPRYWTWSI